ncbi:MAG: caspase family protein [Bauldia sp.]
MAGRRVTRRTSGLRAALALVALLFSGICALAEPRLALVIGNSAYAAGAALANPANDAALMADKLRSVGFEVTALPDLDQRGMKRAVGDFAEKVATAGDGAVALFFYAGHGIQVGGINYLIPVDADIRQESDVAIQSMALPDVLDAIEQGRASVNIVILDACRDNPLKRSFRSATRGLARVNAPAESIVAFSTAEGETAADGTGANSPYTTALAATLVTPGLPIEQVFKQVGRKVKEATGSSQLPFVASNLYNDFTFVPTGSAAESPATPTTPALANPGPDRAEDDYLVAIQLDTVEGYRDFLLRHSDSARAAQIRNVLAVKVEDEAWQRAEVAGTPVELRKYLAAFPDGPHAAEVGQMIAALAAPPPQPEPPPAAPARRGDNCDPPGAYRVVDIPSNDILSIRSAAGKQFPEIAQIPPGGGGVAIGRCIAVDGYEYPWCEVSYDCTGGWAYARYLADPQGNRPGLTGAATASAGPETYRVTGVQEWDVLNMRSGPGTNYPIVVPIPPDGRGVSVGSCRRVGGFATKWCSASWQGYSGWASACCLTGERTGRRAD